MSRVKIFLDFLYRSRRHLATAAFLLGFLVDIITFRSINLELSQIILAGYLVIVAGSILVLATQMSAKSSETSRVQTWLPIVHQYAAGNLLSAFLVLYFSSGSLFASWPFLILVALAAVGNEIFSLEKYRIPFQTTLFFLNLTLFFALAVPILFGSLGLPTFLWSLGLSFGTFLLFFLTGAFIVPHTFTENTGRIAGGAFIVGGLLLALYVTHLIPPIPLSLKSVGLYHSITKTGDTYTATDETHTLLERLLNLGDTTLHLTSGEAAYAYTSVFAPAHFGADIVHQWEFFDSESGDWVVKNRVAFPILGGRHEGYRGYSFIENPAPGRWRVSVETADGAIIGRAYLLVERVSVPWGTLEKTLD